MVVGSNPDHQIGAFLGDFVKGPLSTERPLHIEQGIWHHRQLDAWSNQHEGMRECAAEFGEQHRRVAPILLDLFIDHFLCRNWQQFHNTSLREFSRQFYQDLSTRETFLPERALNWLVYAQKKDLLMGYGELERLKNIVRSMDERRRKPLGLTAAFEAGVSQYSLLEKRFFDLFPDIVRQSNVLNSQFPAAFGINPRN
ncbi:ACP phosphodiesterase [Sessilibacter corallicola]|uniref:ACP phosphodiesterase n=1 Tax=Sessilibacter corallicola TaxID=2904075 RepID=A0ABQ0ABQ1_9GAMM